MADCSTAGTVLDQVVATAVGSSTSSREGKAALTSLMGHAVVGGNNNVTAMPLAPPTALLAPHHHHQQQQRQQQQRQQQQQQLLAPSVVANAIMQQQQPQAMNPPIMMHPLPTMQVGAIGPSPHYQQQQQQMMMQQQMQMMAMSMQMHHQQQQMKMKSSTNQEISTTTTTAAAETSSLQQTPLMTLDKLKEQIDQLDDGKDPFYKHVQEEMHRLVHEYEGRQQQVQEEQVTLDDWTDGLDDGFAGGASMEELAAAWAQAEAEYDIEVVENATNLAAGVTTTIGDQQQQQQQQHLTEEQLYPYEFKTKVDTTATQQTASDPPDYLQIGLDAFERGDVPQAMEALETLLQTIDPDHAKAWFTLGKCHAENDMDRDAIACLERAVERDPYFADAQLALGVSYVNELNHTKALTCLKHWITHNAEYAHLVQDDNDNSNATTGELGQVQALLKSAAAAATSTEHEADIQEALGVVYNVSREYAAAIECFQKALEVRPLDYALYNKLGATLANSNQSEKALESYQHALEYRPRYPRAWLNMAISHSNCKQYDEAVRCYLQTLALNPQALHCWSYLRIALSCAERWDLLSHVADQDLQAFTKHYDFVLE